MMSGGVAVDVQSKRFDASATVRRYSGGGASYMNRVIRRAMVVAVCLSPLAGFAACLIPVHPSPIHRGWGWPFPVVLWEKITTPSGESWIDFPNPLAIVLNPLACLLGVGAACWLLSKLTRPECR